MTTTCTITRCRRPATERYCGFDVCKPHLDAAHAINTERNEAHERGEQTGRRRMDLILEEMRNA